MPYLVLRAPLTRPRGRPAHRRPARADGLHQPWLEADRPDDVRDVVRAGGRDLAQWDSATDRDDAPAWAAQGAAAVRWPPGAPEVPDRGLLRERPVQGARR